jgi:hydroxyacylglutathione hydrolase
MQITVVPCLRDNYAYLVRADGAGDAFVVDPSEAEPVAAAIEREGIRLVAIVNTHHHHDHVGGNEGLLERYGAMPVVAFEGDRGRVPAQTKGVADGESFEIAGLSLRALHVPGHTTGAISYVVDGAVFTGDTLFAGGCGRLFEGSPADMNRSLNERLGKLPPETRVYCGHEYTVANLRFAAEVDPDNAAVGTALAEARAARERGEPTVPSTIGRELATNPFMRVATPALAGRFGGGDSVSVLAAVRKAKDVWKG